MRIAPLILLLAATLTSRAADFLVYAGTHTGSGSKGIYAWRFRTESAKLTPLGVAAETGNPSFLLVHSSHKFLYAVNENGGAGVLGSVSAYSIDARTGKLAPLNWVSSKGGAPCQLALDHTAKWLAVANCAADTIAILPVQSDGRLGEAVITEQRSGAHPRSLLFSPDNRFLLAAGLGAYHFDAAKGSLSPAGALPAEPGPIAFHPDGTVLYAVNEKSNTITAYRYDPATAAIQEFASLPTAPENFIGANSPAGILINPAGTVLYVSNPALDVLTQFAIDPEKHSLTPMEFPPVMGKAPAQVALDPTGAYLFSANQKSANLTIFRVHPHTGQLQPAGPVAKNVPNPTCVVFVP
ncbi:MAG TPA: lactonase family protein [Candidatus Sulfopaludibacter sp.]|nr:lactonase family protein [Candidatus Sulfopaludibacter sp.]